MAQEPKIPKTYGDLFAKLGVSEKSLKRIRFGGVVGKQALVAAAVLVIIGIIAFKSGSQTLLWGCLIGGVFIAAVTICAMGFHGHKHPLEATLEGGEIVAWKQIEQLAAKGMHDVPDSPKVLEGIGQRPPNRALEGENT